jgi:hypothetical protein
MSAIGTRVNFTNVAAGSNPRTVSVTNPSGTGRKLVVVAVNDVGVAGTGTINSATYDATSMTSFYSRVSDDVRERWFYYDIPDAKGTGAYNVAVTVSADSGGLAIAAWITTGDIVGEPQVAAGSAIAGVNTLAASVDTNSGDALFAVFTHADGSRTATAASSQVTMGNAQSISTSGARTSKADAIGDATETVTVTWTVDNTTGTKNCTLVNTTPAVSGPTITVQPTAQTSRLFGESAGSGVTFSFACASPILSALWELETAVGSNAYATISNGGLYVITTNTGAGTGSLVVTPTDTTLSGRRFRVTPTDVNGSMTSNAVVLTVWMGPRPATFEGNLDGSSQIQVKVSQDEPGTLVITAVESGNTTMYTTNRFTAE